MDFTTILAIILIIIIVIIILGFVMWYRSRKTPPDMGELPEDYFEGPIEREFRCPNCGVSVEPDEIICHECGSEFREGEYECPQCGNLVDPNELECPHCNYVFEMEPNVCPNCGHVVALDATECPNCHEQFWSALKLPVEEEEGELPKTLPGMEKELPLEKAEEAEK